MALAAELASINSPGGPTGGESSVLNANHAKFVAVLTAAAAEAAARKCTKSPSKFVIKDKEEVKRLLRLGGIESAFDMDAAEVVGEGSSASSATSAARMPKLSYDTSASSETDISLSFVDGGRPLRFTASSAPSAMTSTRIKTPRVKAPAPKQPIFAKYTRYSPTGFSSLLDEARARENSLEQQGIEFRWRNMKREANVSVDSQMSAASDGTTEDDHDEDPFQPRVAVW